MDRTEDSVDSITGSLQFTFWIQVTKTSGTWILPSDVQPGSRRSTKSAQFVRNQFGQLDNRHTVLSSSFSDLQQISKSCRLYKNQVVRPSTMNHFWGLQALSPPTLKALTHSNQPWSDNTELLIQLFTSIRARTTTGKRGRGSPSLNRRALAPKTYGGVVDLP